MDTNDYTQCNHKEATKMTIYTDKQQWLLDRRLGITSTDIAAIMGVHPYKTQHQVWLDKTHGDTFQGNDATEIGTALEPYIKDRYVRQTGAIVDAHNALYVHPTASIVRASTDYAITNDPRGKGLLECKSMNDWVAKNMPATGVPDTWYTQGMYQLAATGFDFVDFAICNRTTGHMQYYTVLRDELLIANMIKCAEDWWSLYIIGKIEPQKTADEWADTPQIADSTIEADEANQIIWAKLVDISGVIKSMTKTQSELKDKLKIYMQDNETLTHGAATLATFKIQARRTIKVEDAVAKFGEEANSIIKTSETRTFNVKESK